MRDETKRFVDKCYREILRRPADVSGVQTYGRLIEVGVLKRDGLAKLLMESPEYKSKAIQASQPSDFPPRKMSKLTTVVFASTWAIRCGISEYTRYLTNALGNLGLGCYVYRNPNAAPPTVDLIHCMHEFGLYPNLSMDFYPHVPKVVTWHTVVRDPHAHMKLHRQIDAHIVHTEIQRSWLSQNCKDKPVHLIPHGSYVWNHLSRDAARNILGLPTDRKTVFMFGFSGPHKGYDRAILAAPKVNAKVPTLFVISAGPHQLGWNQKYDGQCASLISQTGLANSFMMLRSYLNDDQINLYADAADAFLFNYQTAPHVASASGAVHRVIHAGKPLICSRDNLLAEFAEVSYTYASEDLDGMANKIVEALTSGYDLGLKARAYAEATSWQNIAKTHINVYRSFLN